MDIGVVVLADNVVVADDRRVVSPTIVAVACGVAVAPDNAFNTAKRFSKSLRRTSSRRTPGFASARTLSFNIQIGKIKCKYLLHFFPNSLKYRHLPTPVLQVKATSNNSNATSFIIRSCKMLKQV